MRVRRDTSSSRMKWRQLGSEPERVPSRISSRMRCSRWYWGRLLQQQNAGRASPGTAVGVGCARRPGLSPPPPLKLPSKRWRDLILRVWHVDPVRFPVCQSPMHVIAVIDDPRVCGEHSSPPRCLARPARRPVPAGRCRVLHGRTVCGCGPARGFQPAKAHRLWASS
jgi:hypothetical protein